MKTDSNFSIQDITETVPERTPVVFIHGTRTSSKIWTAQENFLNELGYPTKSIDLPGHGTRSHQTFTLDNAYQVIDEAIAELDQPVLLVGMSLGGYVSLGYAARNEAKIAGVLAAACSAETKRQGVLFYRLFSQKLSHAAKKVRIALSARPSTKPDWAVVTDMLNELGRMSSLDNLVKITVPVWLVSGRWDFLRVNERRYLAARPQTKKFIIDGAGHDVNLHAPLAFNRTLVNMLSSLMPRGAS